MSISRKKRTTFTVAISLACLCAFLPVCSRGEKTNAPEEVNSQEKTGNSEKAGIAGEADKAGEKSDGILSWTQALLRENPEETQNTKVFQQDKVLRLGETGSLGKPTNENPERIGMECTVNTAKIYNTPEEAGLDMEQVKTEEEDLLYDIETELPAMPADTTKLNFLMCDVTIKNINVDIGSQNITMLDVVCLTSDGVELRHSGLPAYFSHSVDVNGHRYYNFELPAGESMDAKVGWWIDLEQYKKENLYVMYNFGGELDIQRLWDLEL